jgi:hypothetical protein
LSPDSLTKARSMPCSFLSKILGLSNSTFDKDQYSMEPRWFITHNAAGIENHLKPY